MTIPNFHAVLLAAHVTAVVFLVGGIFAHDRILQGAAGQPQPQQHGALDGLLRLDRHVTTPALLLTWALGLTLAMSGGWFPSTWLSLKLILVVGLSALHGVQSGRLRRIIGNQEPARGMRGVGVIVPVATLAIAVLAVAKP